MLYRTEVEERTAGGRAGPVYSLLSADGSTRAEVWAAHGFNCLRWQTGGPGRWRDLLYVDPQWHETPVPTRSGVPVLFPFPNRIRDGKYQFLGQEFQLPVNDNAGKNAIHGFSPRRPWRVVGNGAGARSAWVTGQFHATEDAPDTLNLWPSDYRITATIRLTTVLLRYEFRVENVGRRPFPFGLGLHPYFRLPHGDPGEGIARYRLHAPAKSVWVLDENLPTGAQQDPAGDADLNRPRLIGDAVLDTLYTDLGTTGPTVGGLLPRAELRHADFGGAIQVLASPGFRESLVFTPPHRKAVCVEPYTCATDAANLAERGVDAGWRVLEPGGDWSGAVEFRWDPFATEVVRL